MVFSCHPRSKIPDSSVGYILEIVDTLAWLSGGGGVVLEVPTP